MIPCYWVTGIFDRLFIETIIHIIASSLIQSQNAFQNDKKKHQNAINISWFLQDKQLRNWHFWTPKGEWETKWRHFASCCKKLIQDGATRKARNQAKIKHEFVRNAIFS